MSKFNGGWNEFQQNEGYPISDIITYASLNGVLGDLEQTTIFNHPVGSWNPSPAIISANPNLIATNGGTLLEQQRLADSLNLKTQFINTNAPPDLQNLVFCYGNYDCNLDFMIQIPLNLGADTFKDAQLSYLINSVVKGDVNNQVEVFNFGSGTFTGNVNLILGFNNFFAPVQLGLNLFDITNPQSSMFAINTVVIPIDTDIANEIDDLEAGLNFINENPENKGNKNVILATKKQAPKPKTKPNFSASSGTGKVELVNATSQSSTLITRRP